MKRFVRIKMKQQLLFMALFLSFGLNLAAASAGETEVEIQRHSFVRVLSGPFAGLIGTVVGLNPGSPKPYVVRVLKQDRGMGVFFDLDFDSSELECCQLWKDPLG